VNDFTTDIAALMEPVARMLLGAPNATLSSENELRYGSHGSLSVNLAKSNWYDFERGCGGGVFDLICDKKGLEGKDALDWIERQGLKPAHEPTPRRKALRPSNDEAAQHDLARYLFTLGQPVERSAAAIRYLREARAYKGPIPSTIRYLPARGKHRHALVCAYGIPDEVEPGVLRLAEGAVRGVHLIKFNADGSDRHRPTEADPESAKITIGRCLGSPIVCAPFAECNNALVIAEGVEDALTAHEAMGISAWAAGGAARMPALADRLPDYVDCVSVLVDDNAAGCANSDALARLLCARDIEVRLVPPFEIGSAAR
jgi:hypothetical protein